MIWSVVIKFPLFVYHDGIFSLWSSFVQAETQKHGIEELKSIRQIRVRHFPYFNPLPHFLHGLIIEYTFFGIWNVLFVDFA